MEGGKAEDAGAHPAFEKFGGGQNEPNRSEVWRGSAGPRSRGLFSPFTWKIKSY